MVVSFLLNKEGYTEVIQYEKNVTTIIRDINDSFWEREIRCKNWSYSNYHQKELLDRSLPSL